MMFYDRLTGVQIKDLPERILPGRYCNKKTLTQNFDDLILDDGSGSIKFEGVEKKFLQIEFLDDDEVDFELLVEAIVAISNKLQHAPLGQKISPMLPSEMASQCELDDLEISLIGVVRDGHLHSISDRPRIDLRYDDQVSPVSRARRLASTALSHLSSHSDCWQQRTLSGIKPRKILARFSEDDYSIYENRLFKRLIDRLETRIANRLARIKKLNSRLQKALEFQNSDKTHYRLRQDVCTIWGESFDIQSTSLQLESGRRAIAELENLLRTLRGLKQRGLFVTLPPNTFVPSQVHRTNILNHDPHYRHLPPLWEKLKTEKEDRQLSHEEQLEKQKNIHASYKIYIGLVLKRSLERFGSFSTISRNLKFDWGGEQYSVIENEQGWSVVNPVGDSLTFISVAWFGKTFPEIFPLNSNTIVCWPGTSESVGENQRMPISPLDLYVVEKMGRIIDEWLIFRLVKNYRINIGPLPKDVQLLTDSWPQNFEKSANHSVKLFAPLNSNQIDELKLVLDGVVSPQVKSNFLAAISQLSSISSLCGHKTKFASGGPNGFHCHCLKCERTWSLNISAKKINFSMRPKDASEITNLDGFSWSGRDWIDFDVVI